MRHTREWKRRKNVNVLSHKTGRRCLSEFNSQMFGHVRFSVTIVSVLFTQNLSRPASHAAHADGRNLYHFFLPRAFPDWVGKERWCCWLLSLSLWLQTQTNLRPINLMGQRSVRSRSFFFSRFPLLQLVSFCLVISNPLLHEKNQTGRSHTLPV